jgi:hypothetical protein
MNLVLLHLYNFTAAGFATAATELLFLGGALAAFQSATGEECSGVGLLALFVACNRDGSGPLLHGRRTGHSRSGWGCAGIVVGCRDTLVETSAAVSQGNGGGQGHLYSGYDEDATRAWSPNAAKEALASLVKAISNSVGRSLFAGLYGRAFLVFARASLTTIVLPP